MTSMTFVTKLGTGSQTVLLALTALSGFLVGCVGLDGSSGGGQLLPEATVEQEKLQANRNYGPLKGAFVGADTVPCYAEAWEDVFGNTERTYLPLTKVAVEPSSIVAHSSVEHIENFLYLSPQKAIIDFEITPVWIAPLNVETSIICDDGQLDAAVTGVVMDSMIFPARRTKMREGVFEKAGENVEETGLAPLTDTDISTDN